MHERNQRGRLSGRIEIDDAYLGGERPGGAEHKFPFVVARKAIRSVFSCACERLYP